VYKEVEMFKSIAVLFTILFLVSCSPSRFVLPPEQPVISPMPPSQPIINDPGVILPTPSVTHDRQPGDEHLIKGPVYLDSAELLVLESFPLQYRLALKGNLPDPCHELRVEIPAPDAENRIDIQVFSLADPGRICIQVLEPFEESVSLDGFPPGTYQVEVNGEMVGQIEVFAPLDEPSMKGYELYAWQSEGNWWFSLLLGTNRAKTVEEVTDPDFTLQGVDALTKLLSTFPEGEFISMLPIPGSVIIAVPPQEMLNEIGALCESRGLECALSTP
jgi:hypothetical protein